MIHFKQNVKASHHTATSQMRGCGACHANALKSILLALALCFGGLNAAAFDKGDINGDGAVNVSDVTTLVNIILNVNPSYSGNPDVNGDGAVNVSDVTAVVNLILGTEIDTDLKVVGGDISMLPEYENHGAKYYDKAGRLIPDVLTFYKDQNLNAMRVRLFVDPSKVSTTLKKEGVIQDLDYVCALGKRIKDMGMKFVLDFHYSDSWADPGKQTLPSGWVNMTIDQLADTVYGYTKASLQALIAAGATPDYVQVGNEVTYGMLWPTGRCWSDGSGYNSGTWENFARYLNAGSRAVREACPNAQVIVHIELSTLSRGLQFFTTAQWHNVDYDIMGLSYYPAYHGYSGIMSSLDGVLTQLETNFPDRHIMIMETGYSYKWAMNGTKYDFTAEYPYNNAGQAAFVKDFIAMLNTHKNVKGLFWWWPEANEYGVNYQNSVTSSWWNASLVDNNNGVTQQGLYELQGFRE